MPRVQAGYVIAVVGLSAGLLHYPAMALPPTPSGVQFNAFAEGLVFPPIAGSNGQIEQVAQSVGSGSFLVPQQSFLPVSAANKGSVTITENANGVPTPIKWSAQGSGHAQGAATFGALSVEADVAAQVTPAVVAVQTAQGLLDFGSPASSGGGAQATARFVDNLTIEAVPGSNHHTGDPVDLSATAQIRGCGAVIGGIGSGGGGFSFFANILDGDTGASLGGPGQPTGFSLTGSAICPAPTFNQQVTLHAVVGERVNIDATMAVSVNSEADHTGPMSGLAQGNVVINLDVLTPGVTYMSESGHDYFRTPVPEPATFALLGVGLLPLGARLLAQRIARS